MYKSELPEYFSDTCFVEEELSVEFPYSMAQLRVSTLNLHFIVLFHK